LLRAIAELDKKGPDSAEPLRDLGSILLHAQRTDLVPKRDKLEGLAKQGQLALTRQIAYGCMATIDGSVDIFWSNASPNSAQIVDLLLGIPLISDGSLRGQFYAKIKDLLRSENPPEIQRAAITAIVALPGHDSETFQALAGLVRNGVQTDAAIDSLGHVPHSAWQKDQAAPLIQHIVKYLQDFPTDQRTAAPFANALQLATELAHLLPPEAERMLARTLRKIGPTVITLRAVFEQMRFDQDLVVVEAAKTAVIILQNDDAMPHNVAILAPGSLEEIGLAAEKMPPEPDSQGRLYVPASPKVLQATRLVSPGQKVQLGFEAPTEAADYPYTCTFPGHWLRMSGIMKVVPDVDVYLASHPPSEQPKLTEWKLADFYPDLSRSLPAANPAAGKELFSKLACLQCHKLGAEGYAYGPELTDVFKRYKNDRASVLQQILEPSKTIEERYRNSYFELKDGDSLTGMILKENDQNVTIQSGPADSLIQVLKKSEIQQRRVSSSSPMPVGLLNGLSKSQIFDLLAYVESGGTSPLHEHNH
jgi:putative heme-binding domain-containing protein